MTLQQIGVCHRGLSERQDDVASVAYWYQDRTPQRFCKVSGKGISVAALIGIAADITSKRFKDTTEAS